MPHIHENLSHLNTEEINQVIQLYKAGNKVSDIADQYNITLQHGSLSPLLPHKVLDKLCPHCQIPMQQKRSRGTKPPVYCPSCNHEDVKYCRCKNCNQKRLQTGNAVRDLVLNVQKTDPINAISPVHRLYLTALLNTAHITEGLIQPLSSSQKRLTPNNSILNDRQIVEELYFEGIIHVSDKSTLNAFPEEEKGSFYTNKVYWQSNVTDFLMTQDFTIQPEDAIMLWRSIAGAEVMEYLIYQIGEVRQTFTPDASVTEAIYSFLNTFSVGQIYSIIWSSINYSNRFYTEGRLTRKDFTSHVIKACQRYAERAIAEGWMVKTFNRCKQLPQSEVSKTLNQMLDIDGFSVLPV